jgi:GTPase
MFATLDPKLRAVELPSRRKVLLSDTVGFIRNLPHTLVTSFRATLEEVAQAEVLLHVRDASSSYGEEQKAQVEKVLGELESLSKPRIEVLNKIDLLPAEERAALVSRTNSRSGSIVSPTRQLATSRSDANPPGDNSVPTGGLSAPIAISALTGEGTDALFAAIDRALHSDPVVEAELRVPQHEGAALAAIEAGMIVHSRAYEGNLVRLTVSGPASLVGRMRRFRCER